MIDDAKQCQVMKAAQTCSQLPNKKRKLDRQENSGATPEEKPSCKWKNSFDKTYLLS